MATVNVEVGQVILGDRVEDSLAENNLQGEINNHNEEIKDNQEKVGAIAVEEHRAEEMSDQCETVDMATLEGWDKVGSGINIQNKYKFQSPSALLLCRWRPIGQKIGN